MWHKSEDSKAKSSPGAPSSPDPSEQHPGSAVPSDSASAPATVSRGINIKGELSGEGDFSLDGVFEGKVHIPYGTFTVGPNARVTAEIEAREIIVRGEVIGTLKAHERIQIRSTGKVTGDMDTRGIMIEDGAVLHSKVAVPQAGVGENDHGSKPPSSEIPPRSKGAAAGAAAPPSQPET
jgi:cytoskeletal protein CcmA (bactofilin family)